MQKTFVRMYYGFRKFTRNKIRFLLLIMPCILVLLGNIYLRHFDSINTLLICNNILNISLIVFSILLVLVVNIFVIYIHGFPMGYKKIENGCRKIGIKDSQNNTPLFVDKWKDGNYVMYEFYSDSITLLTFDNKQAELETLLNRKITFSNNFKDLRRFIFKTIPAHVELPDFIRWNNSLLSKDTSEIIIGRTVDGVAKTSFKENHHTIIAGGSGSGKSKLAKLMIYQAIMHGDTVYICDMKYGLDYQGFWKDKCRLVTNKQDLNALLDYFIEEREKRANLLLMRGASDVDEYNKTAEIKLNRMILMCDELAEVLRKVDKKDDDYELNKQIETKLKSISALSRAFNQNLILGTQRPSAEIVDSDIKANCSLRICGRADSILSKMIIDNTKASEVIEPDAIGKFITNNGQIFKAYYLDEDGFEVTNYERDNVERQGTSHN